MVSGVQVALAVGPVLGVVSGCGAEALVRRTRPASGAVRVSALVVAAVLVVATAAWRVAGEGHWWQAAVLMLAAVAVPLSAVDLAEQRIPNAVLAPAFVLGALLLGGDAAVGHHFGAVMRAMLAASVLYGSAFVLLLSARDSLGYGDVKALAYQGLYAGYVGWGRVLGALLLTFIAAAAAALALRAVRSGRVRPRLAFAPYVLGATLAAVLA